MNVPEWKDFAPSAFINVKEPKGLGKLNVTAKYWFERRIAFEEGLANCKATETYEERFSCYEHLKIKQFKDKKFNYNSCTSHMLASNIIITPNNLLSLF